MQKLKDNCSFQQHDIIRTIRKKVNSCFLLKRAMDCRDYDDAKNVYKVNLH